MGDTKQPVEPPFPVEVWERIFRFCSAGELLRLRRVCHRWDGIVSGCPELRQQLLVEFKKQKFRKGFVPARLPPAARAQFKGCGIRSVDSWWPDFGRNLTQLDFYECRIGTAMLFRMLRGCPLLKEFSLCDVNLLGDLVDAVDFKLDAMERIYMDTVSFCEENFAILDWFRGGFPRLKYFALLNADDDIWFELETDNLIQLLEAVKGTLVVLKLSLNDELLKRLCEVGPLQVKAAQYNIDCSSLDWDISLWKKFFKNQPSLTEITLYNSFIYDEALEALVTNTPNLKSLATDLISCSPNVPTFLSNLIAVECVIIRVVLHHNLAFSAPFSSSLKDLLLVDAHIVDGLAFLMNSSHLQKLTLVNCNLSKCHIPLAVQTFSTLKHLALIDCKMSQKQLEYVERCHPVLEIVRFDQMKSVRIDTVVALLLLSPKLHRVELANCARFAADSTGAQIMRHYHRVHGSAEGSRDVAFEFN